MIKRGDLALNESGFLGMITNEEPDGPQQYDHKWGWIGIHLTDQGEARLGDDWISKKPKVISHIMAPDAQSIIRLFSEDKRWATYPGDYSKIISHHPGRTKITVTEHNHPHAIRYQCDEDGIWKNTTAGKPWL